MRKSPKSQDFKIHVDSSCLTDSTDLRMPSKRNNSDQTVIHDEIGSDAEAKEEKRASPNRPVHDKHTEALIRAAARAVVASIGKEGYEEDDSILGSQADEALTQDETQVTYEDRTELSYEEDQTQPNDSEAENHDDDPYDGSASSHHEDDVFSEDQERSHRSSLDSSDHHQTDEDKEEKTEGINQAEISFAQNAESVSRISSICSNAFSVHPEPLNLESSQSPRTPNKLLSKQPFRTPSSVRVIQMSSPQPSIFSGSPRSSRPTVSRLGSPQSQRRSATNSKNTPRPKFKKEYPLVLLHVTILPLNWPYADVIETVEMCMMSQEFVAMKDSWRLLQEKLGDTVFERGILLPHPQDSYETLEERLLEALEIPVRPRAKILSCGHYVGPGEDDLESEEDSEIEEDDATAGEQRWCDICGDEVRYKEFGIGPRRKRFKVKVYASNGLMGAGAWEAAWREMERIDVEIEPLVPSRLLREMDGRMADHMHGSTMETHMNDLTQTLDREVDPHADMRRRLEEERLREIYGNPSNTHISQPEKNQNKRPTARRRKDESLLELLLEASKVLMKDRKNIIIGVMSVLIIVLAILPGRTASYNGHHSVARVEMVGSPGTHFDHSDVSDVETAKDNHIGKVSIKSPEIMGIERGETTSQSHIVSSPSDAVQVLIGSMEDHIGGKEDEVLEDRITIQEGKVDDAEGNE